jgi:hypothetical protein
MTVKVIKKFLGNVNTYFWHVSTFFGIKDEDRLN